MATSFDHIRRELAYLRGMTDGEHERGNHPLNARAFHRLIQLLDEWMEETERMARRQEELEEYVEAIDEDLNELEMTVYEGEDFEEDAGYLKVNRKDEGGGRSSHAEYGIKEGMDPSRVN